MKKTILICSNVYPPKFIGGAELIAHYQAQALQRLGHEVVVFTGDVDEVGSRHELRFASYDKVPVYRTRLTDDDFNVDNVSFLHDDIEEQFQRVLERHRPNVVHAHNLMGLSVGILARARHSGARTVVTLHDHWGFCMKNTIMKPGYQLCTDFNLCHECKPTISDGENKNIPIRLRNDFTGFQLERCDHLISPSRYLAQQYIRAGFPDSRIQVIWNGINVQRFSAIKKRESDGVVRFTFIGYLGDHKGVRVLLDAAEKLAAQTTRFLVNFVGVGVLEPLIAQKMDTGGLGQVLRLIGRVPNEKIDEIFAETDVQILPSIWPENQPVSITEAMAARTPVICSALGGTQELVDDGQSGYLVEAGNASALADAMKRFIDDPARIEPFGAHAFEKIRHCSFENQARKLLDLYDSPPAEAPDSKLVILPESRFTPGQAERLNALDRIDAGTRTRIVPRAWLTEADLRQAPR